jgi:hypothetical protein
MPAPSRIRKRSYGTGMFQVQATGVDLREISKALRAQNTAAVTKRFRKELRYAAAPFVPAVRAAISNIPVKGQSSSGLRSRLSRAVTLLVRVSGKNARVSVLMSTAKMPDGQKALPAYMEGVKSPWRHPVFEDHDSDNWVEQPAHPYFFNTVRDMSTAGKAAVNRVVNQITGAIT